MNSQPTAFSSDVRLYLTDVQYIPLMIPNGVDSLKGPIPPIMSAKDSYRAHCAVSRVWLAATIPPRATQRASGSNESIAALEERVSKALTNVTADRRVPDSWHPLPNSIATAHIYCTPRASLRNACKRNGFTNRCSTARAPRRQGTIQRHQGLWGQEGGGV